MTAPAVTVCATCSGETTVVVETRSVDVEVPCPGCSCSVCGKATTTPPECIDCWDRAERNFKRRCDQ